MLRPSPNQGTPGLSNDEMMITNSVFSICLALFILNMEHVLAIAARLSHLCI